jgi:hypothetical protein
MESDPIDFDPIDLRYAMRDNSAIIRSDFIRPIGEAIKWL